MFYESGKIFECKCVRPVVPKVGGIAPLWSDCDGKGDEKTKGGEGRAKQRKGRENSQPLIDH